MRNERAPAAAAATAATAAVTAATAAAASASATGRARAGRGPGAASQLGLGLCTACGIWCTVGRGRGREVTLYCTYTMGSYEKAGYCTFGTSMAHPTHAPRAHGRRGACACFFFDHLVACRL